MQRQPLKQLAHDLIGFLCVPCEKRYSLRKQQCFEQRRRYPTTSERHMLRQRSSWGPCGSRSSHSIGVEALCARLQASGLCAGSRVGRKARRMRRRWIDIEFVRRWPQKIAGRTFAACMGAGDGG